MRILFLGTPEFAVPSLAALVEAGHEVACVVTQPDRPSGRRRQVTDSPVKRLATERGLPVRQSDDVNDPAFVEGLAALRPELIVVAAFGQKLGRRLLSLPTHGCINVHASLLPRHRGAAPVAHALLAGDAETGVSLLRMAAAIDSGDILAQEAVPIAPTETTGQLTARLAALGARLLLQVVGQVAGGWEEAIPQDPARSTRAPSLRKDDGLMDWTRPAATLDRFVRAMTPWPGAFTFWCPPSKPPLRLVVHEAVPGAAEQEAAAAAPGTVVALDAGRISVQTGDGLLHLLRLQPAGKREMTAAEFLCGYKLPVGSAFGSSERAKPDA